MAKIKNQNKTQTEVIGAGQVITAGWAILMFTVFPIIFTDYYFNILQTKYIAYLAISGVFVLAMIVAALLKKIEIDWRLSRQDYWLIAFFAIVTISTLQAAPYISEAIFGNEGRYTGWLLLLAYCTTFFLASRFFKMYDWILKAFLWVGLFMGFFAVTDFLDMNILHFKDYIAEENYWMFTSTLGNINTYTAFAGLMAGFAGALMIFSDREWQRILFYAVCFAGSVLGGICASSDNFYLAIGAFLLLVPIFALKSWKTLRRYFLSLSIFMASMELVQYWEIKYAEKVMQLGGLFGKVVSLSPFKYAVIACIIITIALYVFTIVKKLDNVQLPKWPSVVWGILLIVGFAGGVAVLVWANTHVVEAKEMFGGIADYMVFGDHWGTNRGYIWRACIEDYLKLPFIHKVFGTGPDTFGIYMVTGRYYDMVTHTGQYYDSAHNEYLQYLFTIGPLGLASYIGLIVSILRGCFKKANEKGHMLYAYAFLIICYCAQAIVNINLPIITPILWAIMAMAASEIREVKPKKEKVKEEAKGETPEGKSE